MTSAASNASGPAGSQCAAANTDDPRLAALIKRGQALHAQARYAQAIEHWTWVCEAYPENAEAGTHLGLAWFGQGDVDVAARQFKLMRERFADSPWGHFGLGLLHEARHEWAGAIGVLRTALALAPQHAAVHEHLAHCLGRAGQSAEALRHSEIALQLDPASRFAATLRAHLSRPRKADMINALVRAFSLASYLEYNKFTGELAFDAVQCARKDMVFLPELQYRDADAQQRAQAAAGPYAGQPFVAPDALIAHLGARRYDLIFFDPMHVRPDVDRCLQMLPRCLNPGGFLLVHDCNPEDEALITTERRPDEWLGETYKAFALFHKHNPARSVTVSEDYGVGIILNEGLSLDYNTSADIGYHAVAADRPRHLGLLGWPAFMRRLATGDRLAVADGRVEVLARDGAGDAA